MKHTLPASWITALAVALLLGIGSYAAPVVPSVAAWDADAARAVRANSALALAYLTTQPQSGHRIADSLYLALLEGEDAWAAVFLERQQHALQHAVARVGEQDAPERAAAALTLQTLQHYQALIAAGQHDQDAFQRLVADPVGPQLREQALRALHQADR
jgi:hypothetical protein